MWSQPAPESSSSPTALGRHKEPMPATPRQSAGAPLALSATGYHLIPRVISKAAAEPAAGAARGQGGQTGLHAVLAWAASLTCSLCRLRTGMGRSRNGIARFASLRTGLSAHRTLIRRCIRTAFVRQQRALVWGFGVGRLHRMRSRAVQAHPPFRRLADAASCACSLSDSQVEGSAGGGHERYRSPSLLSVTTSAASDVQLLQRKPAAVPLDELPPRAHLVAHQQRKHVAGLRCRIDGRDAKRI